MKVLFVCLGNICRSPLAEGIFKAIVQDAGLNWEIDSAGTAGYHVGESPHPLSQKTALQYGVDIRSQKCRQFKLSDMTYFDKIYCLDTDNLKEVKRMSGAHWDASKTSLILDALYPGQNKSVPDPWYGEEPGYHEVYHLISRACNKIFEALSLK